ncbi:MAG: Asp23/Gls24 family envelope stress response protein [Kiritimatiellae bacterium]|nr:Asp23/Gls24 family envelope stress response protein [Kiritimatiellia bacterium]
MGVSDHLEEGTDLGAIRIHNNVIAVISRLAALKVPGVAGMSSTLVDDIAGIIGKKNIDRGIRVEVEENTVIIDLHVIFEYGVRIPQVSWQLQNDIREAIEQMTGKHVKAVNVVVQSVRMPGEDSENTGAKAET